MTRPARPLRSLSAAATTTVLALALGGCSMPDSSNPTLSISRASVQGDRATLDMRIDNPSSMDVRVDSIDWTLVQGPLPVADGTWDMGVNIPSKGAHSFSKQIVFTSPSLDPAASEIEFSGRLDMASGASSLDEASFVVTTPVNR